MLPNIFIKLYHIFQRTLNTLYSFIKLERYTLGLIRRCSELSGRAARVYPEAADIVAHAVGHHAVDGLARADAAPDIGG